MKVLPGLLVLVCNAVELNAGLASCILMLRSTSSMMGKSFLKPPTALKSAARQNSVWSPNRQRSPLQKHPAVLKVLIQRLASVAHHAITSRTESNSRRTGCSWMPAFDEVQCLMQCLRKCCSTAVLPKTDATQVQSCNCNRLQNHGNVVYFDHMM